MSDPLLFPVGDLENNFDPNPMIRRHGRGPASKTCRQCRHTIATSYRTNRTYWKCRRRGITHGQGTDHRLKWDACRLFEPEDAA